MKNLKDRYKTKLKDFGMATQSVLKAGARIISEPFTNKNLKGVMKNIDKGLNEKERKERDQAMKIKKRYQMP